MSRRSKTSVPLTGHRLPPEAEAGLDSARLHMAPWKGAHAGGHFDEAHHKSAGVRPVFLAILASILGPISSLSWKANTKSGQPSRLSVRCDPDWRFSRHPILGRAA